MPEPKIRYDIEAAVSGSRDVEALVKDLEGLGQTLEGELKTKALAGAAALRQLGEKQAAIAGFVQLKREVSDASTRLTTAQQAAQKLGRELANTEKPTRAQVGQLQKLRDAVNKAKTEVESKTAALDKQRGVLRTYGVDTNQLGKAQRDTAQQIKEAEGQVNVLSRAQQKAAEQARKLGADQKKAGDDTRKSFDGLGGMFDGIRSKALALGAVLGSVIGIRAFTGAVRGAAELEGKLSEVRAVSGATADEMVRLRKAAEDAGATTKFTATEAADALGNLSRAGLSARQSVAALPATLSLSQAGGIGLAEASALVTRSLAGFGFEADQAGRVADVLAKGANSANTNVVGLGQALSFAAPTAVSLGLSLEDTVAIIGKFADAGIDASRAGTALNSILSQFADSGSSFRRELAAAGITTNDFNEALRQLAASGPRGEAAILSVGREAGPALRALLNQGIGALDQLRGKLLDAEGAAKATADTMEDNLQGAARGLASAWDTVKNTLATPILPVLKEGVSGLAESLRSAVNSGAVQRFGETLAQGFRSALTAAREFLGQVNFQAIGQSISDFAARAGEAFDDVARYAANAGNAVRLSWGVMASGSAVVLSGIYRVGEAFAGVASNITELAGRVSIAWSKVGFGDMARRAESEGRQLIEVSKGLWAASEALARRAEDAMASATEGALLARSGWDGLTEGVGQTIRATVSSAKAFGDLTGVLKGVATEADNAGQKASASAAAQIEAARSARVEVEALKREYEAALKAGDIQGAVSKLQQMQQALNKTAGEAKLTAVQVEAAFERMGAKTKAKLAEAAAASIRDFEIMRGSGEATADVLRAAFRKAADAAVASGDAAKLAWLRATASAQGFEVTVDSAGRTVVRSMEDAAKATDQLGVSAAAAGAQFSGMAKEASAAAAAAAAAASRQAAQNKGRYGSPLENKYGRPTLSSREDRLSGQAVMDLSSQFQLRQKLEGGTLTADDLAELRAVVNAMRQREAVDRQVDRLNPSAFSLEGMRDRREWEQTRLRFEEAMMRLGGGTGSAAGVGRSVRIELVGPGGKSQFVETDESGASALIDTLRAARLSAGG